MLPVRSALIDESSFGHTPIGTCSPRNFELVRSRGAETLFDYHVADCVDEIKRYSNNSLRYVLDCVSDAESMVFCHGCLGRMGGKYTALEPYPEKLSARRTVQRDWVLQLEVLGKSIGWPPPFGRAVPADTKDWATNWFQTVQKLLDDGKLRAHPTVVMPDGLQGILEGMTLITNKTLSGKKLVYPLTGT